MYPPVLLDGAINSGHLLRELLPKVNSPALTSVGSESAQTKCVGLEPPVSEAVMPTDPSLNVKDASRTRRIVIGIDGSHC